MYVDHLECGEQLQHTARRESRRERMESLSQRDVQTITQKRHEDVRFDALLVLMEDRPDRQIAFEVFKRFFHCHQLEIQAPQLGWIALGQIGAQQIASFASPRRAQVSSDSS